jgi:membrane protein DedA with SNARE-associated domain
VGALVWAILIGAGGYFFGNALEVIIGDIKHYEFKIMAAICIGGMVLWIIHLYRLKKYKIPDLSKNGF